MLLAERNSARVNATPGSHARCPSCAADVIAKCGPIKVWHWAHKVNDCDPWAEPETKWHASWKAEFPEHCREVVIGPHRADVRLDTGYVIEFQHSAISAQDIEARENFYRSMAWVVDAEEIEDHFSFRAKGDFLTFRWRWPRRVWQSAACPLFFDFGDSLFRARRIHWHDGESAGGWGRFVDYDRFIGRATACIAKDSGIHLLPNNRALAVSA